MRNVIAERVEKVVVAVMMRSEKFLGLLDEALIVIPHFLRRLSAAALSAAMSISVRGSCGERARLSGIRP